jgi:type I restriction enzyme S subunit
MPFAKPLEPMTWAMADKMEESIAQSLLQAEALRQRILKKAFSGKLV